MDASYFASRLKELRLAKGWSQKKLAEQAGLQQPTIANLEQQRNDPTWPTVVALCKALGVSCEAFTEPPAAEQPAKPKRGRPRKADTSEGEQPAKGKGATTKRTRKRKGDA